MKYKEMNLEDGMRYMAYIRTLVWLQRDDFFVEPFTCMENRLCSFFEKTRKLLADELIIYFHAMDDDSREINDTANIYLYGAYNYITVCQMRSYGRLVKIDDKGRERFNNIILNTLNDEGVSGRMDDMIKDLITLHDNKTALASHVKKRLESGSVFKFTPLSYAYNTYERG